MLFENADGSHVLALLSILILLSSIIMTVTAILQGLGHTAFPAFVILGSLVLKYSLNMLLVPRFGTMGAAIASVATLFLVLLCMIGKLCTIFNTTLINKKFYLIVG